MTKAASNADDVATTNDGVGDDVPASLSEILETSLEKVENDDDKNDADDDENAGGDGDDGSDTDGDGSDTDGDGDADSDGDDDDGAAADDGDGADDGSDTDDDGGEDDSAPTGDDIPPTRLTQIAQEKWGDVPVEVKTEVHRAITELTTGIDEYRDRLQPFAGCDQYADMATQSGTTLQAAMAHYTGLEALLSENPVAGIKQICSNIGVDFKQAGELLMGEAPSTQDAKDVELVNLRQQVHQATAQLQQFQSQRQTQIQAEADQAIKDFSVDKPDFQALKETMGRLITSKEAGGLQDAYDKARALNPHLAAPAPKPAQGKKPKSAGDKTKSGSKPANNDRKAQTRKGSLTKGGAPKGTLTGKPARAKPGETSITDSLQNAFDKVTGG